MFLCADYRNSGRSQDRDADHISDEEKVALNGKPKLGAISRIEVIIRESDDFKVRTAPKIN